MVSSPSLLDRAALTKLKRPVLQQIAMREHIKANAKSTEIVRLLLQKHPDGVPSSRTSQQLLGITEQTIKPEAATADIFAGQSKKRRVEPEPQTSPSPPTISAIRPSGNKDVRFIKRQLTSLVNDRIAIRDEVDKTEKILEHMISVANDISGDIRELSWVRSKIEGDVLRGLKSDRTLWDGTRVMTDPKARKNWERFLVELKAEEKAAIEKRERELELERQREELEAEAADTDSDADVGSQSDGSDLSRSSQRSSQRRKRRFEESEEPE